MPTSSPPATDAVLDPAILDGDPVFEAFAQHVAGLTRRAHAAAGGLWGSSQALVLARLIERGDASWLVVCSTEGEAELFLQDLAAFGHPATLLAAREGSSSVAGADLDSVRRRLQTTQQLAGPEERRPRVVVASLLSLLQPVPSPRELERDFLNLQVGQKIVAEDMLARLVHGGYTRQPLAESPGEISLRGDILDVFPFAADLPVRLELFDEELESLRTFDPETQRSVESLHDVSLCIASDAGGVEDGRGVQPLTLLPLDTHVVEVEPLRVEDQAKGLRVRSSAHARSWTQLRTDMELRRRVTLQSLPSQQHDLALRSVQSFSVGVREAGQLLARELAQGVRCVVPCLSEGERDRFRTVLGKVEGTDGVETPLGSIAKGFRLQEAGVVLLNHRELVGVAAARRKVKERPTHKVRALESFFELRAGDLVVHAVHGVARFVGLERLARAGGEEEHLHLEFKDDVVLYVPVSRLDLVQRYVGSGKVDPDLDKLGGQSFRKRKEKVEKAIVDLAAELLEIQARRELKTREPWPVKDELVDQLVDAFPYEDTPDQATSDAEIAKDLGSKRAMDRLLCGDVGFGKTELAVRAAFRVVNGGAQVAVLVPTTVLAHQHARTFSERLSDFPAEVGLLTRNVTGKRVKETLSRVATGGVDILIGTHRILSKDVAFQRLGLVIIDEEQRFGVTHKEHFKTLRAEVDVLTLSATPIPRTLHLSLSGLRDISALTMPPVGRREIKTVLSWTQENGLIAEALKREKARGGQVFFLHNRVQSIERRARELMALAPECTFAVGHGQMGGRELERVMDTFIRGEADVLVATTIVENGIDIPTAGTILIDDADHYGLAELHQLRGRVGRGDRQSYCYLLVDRTRPLRDVARERLKALEELTQLGAGFQISMKDLEIRGAGNILGAQQSGHIAAIGYDMYCRLLKQTVEELQLHGNTEMSKELLQEIPKAVTEELVAHAVELELGLPAFLPAEWIPDPTARLEVLRQLNAIHDHAEAEEALQMLRDRFGRVPAEAANLVRQFTLRPRLVELGIRRLLYRDETYLLEYGDRVQLEGALAGKNVELRPLRAGTAHLVIPASERAPEAAMTWIAGLLSG